jgi:hypothetical protein
MKTIKVTDHSGVTHYYNPRYIKDVQVIENEKNREWCLNLILDGAGEKINSILFKSKDDLDKRLQEIMGVIESV